MENIRNGLEVPQVVWYNPELASSWWFRPTHLNNMLVNLDHSKRLSVNNKKSLKPPPRGIACFQQNLSSRKLSFLVVHLPGFKLFTWFWKHILETRTLIVSHSTPCGKKSNYAYNATYRGEITLVNPSYPFKQAIYKGHNSVSNDRRGPSCWGLVEVRRSRPRGKRCT